MSSKIKLQTKRFPQSRYIDNYRKLKFLPNFIISFLLLMVLIGLYWYYSGNTTRNRQSPEELLGVSDSAPAAPTSSQLALRPITQENQQFTVQKDGQQCALQFEIDSALNGWVQSPYWWKPVSNCNLSVTGIQLAQLSRAEIGQLQIEKGFDVVKTVNDGWAAMIYTSEDDLIVDFDFISLLEPISENSFSVASASDTKEVNESIFYLSEGCVSKRGCEMWSVPVLGGDLVQIENNLLGSFDETSLEDIDQLRFSRTQDFDDGVNLLIFRASIDEISLVRYDIVRKRIDSIKPLQINTSNYRLYV